LPRQEHRATGAPVIGDVKGHGLDSISDTATLPGAFRAVAHREPSLPDLLEYLDGATRWGLEELGDAESAERFVTVLVAENPDDEPVVHLVNCGHPPPLRLRDATATPLAVPDPAPPLGLALAPSVPYAPTTFPFTQGDPLLLYTDGVTETRDRRGNFYPLAERVTAWAGEAPADLARELTTDLLAYAGGTIHDDMAVVAAARERTGAT
jgi:serine phosphatase RsbU (regulator of sigma subunit)